MKPKEKAIELMFRFSPYSTKNFTSLGIYMGDDSKKCALIAVDEILEAVCTNADINSIRDNARAIYWEEVKKEIEKL